MGPTSKPKLGVLLRMLHCPLSFVLTIHASRFTSHDSRLTIHVPRFTFHANRVALADDPNICRPSGAQFRVTIHASRFTSQDSRLTPHVSRLTSHVIPNSFSQTSLLRFSFSCNNPIPTPGPVARAIPSIVWRRREY